MFSDKEPGMLIASGLFSIAVLKYISYMQNMGMLCMKTSPCSAPEHPHVLYQNIRMFLESKFNLLSIYNIPAMNREVLRFT